MPVQQAASPPKRSRKSKLEPITLDELYASPALNGLVSFLNVKPTQDEHGRPLSRPTVGDDSTPTPAAAPETVPLVDSNKSQSESGVDPNTTSAEGSGGIERSEPTVGLEFIYPPDRNQQASNNPIITERPIRRPPASTNSLPTVHPVFSPTVGDVIQSPVSIARAHASSGSPAIVGPTAKSSTPTVGLDLPPTVARVVTQNFKLSPLRTAQDGHSDLENRVYEAMWGAAGPDVLTEGQRYREVTIGYEKVGQLARTDKQNAKKSIDSLIAKLAIERVCKSDFCRTGAGYRVYSYKAVIARRNAAGYTACVRNRGGVQLWPPKVEEPSPPTVGLNSQPPVAGEVEPTVGRDPSAPTVPVGTEPPVRVDTEPSVTVGEDAPHLNSLISKSLEETSASSGDWQALFNGLRDVIGTAADDWTTTQLLKQSRAVCPDVQVYEILHFARSKAQYRGLNKSITGFLVAAVPLCLKGESFRRFRDEQQIAEQQRRAEYISILRDVEQLLGSRVNRRPEEIEYAESTLTWLRANEPWLFDGQDTSQ